MVSVSRGNMQASNFKFKKKMILWKRKSSSKCDGRTYKIFDSFIDECIFLHFIQQFLTGNYHRHQDVSWQETRRNKVRKISWESQLKPLFSGSIRCNLATHSGKSENNTFGYDKVFSLDNFLSTPSPAKPSFNYSLGKGSFFSFWENKRKVLRIFLKINSPNLWPTWEGSNFLQKISKR